MMAQNQEETQVKLEEYIKWNWDWYLEQYQKKRWGTLLYEADYILRQLGIIVAKKPSVYEIKKEETLSKTVLHFNLYVGTLVIYLKIDSNGGVEAEVIR